MASAPSLDQALARDAAPDLGAAVLGICRAWADVAPDEGFGAALGSLPLRWLLTGAPNGAARAPAEVSAGADLAAAVALLPAGGPDAPAGALFTLRPAAPGPAEATFLAQPPEAMVAGCLLGGARSLLALALGSGAALYARDTGRSGFVRLDPPLGLPGDVAMLAADLGDYRHWERPVRRFADECFAGTEGPQGRDFAFHWTGSLAAEAMAVLLRGGVCLAPAGARPAPSLILAGQPLARLAEAAGGSATDGQSRLLGRAPVSLAETRPVAFGDTGLVARLAACHDLPDADASPLFGRRGLFRS